MGVVSAIPDLSVTKRKKVARFVHTQSSGWRESSSHPIIIQIAHIEKDRGMFYLPCPDSFVCHFIDLSGVESFHGSICDSDHRIRLEIGDPNKRKKETGRWLDKLTVTLKADQLDFVLPVSNSSRLPMSLSGDIKCVSPPCGELQRTVAFNSTLAKASQEFKHPFDREKPPVASFILLFMWKFRPVALRHPR